MVLTKSQGNLLVLLSVANRVEGKTRLVKELFLLNKEEDVEVGYDFKLHHYGPFSEQIGEDVDVLVTNHLADMDVELFSTPEGESRQRTNIFITEQGANVAREITSKMDTKTLEKFHKIVKKYNDMSLSLLLKYVYSNYVPS